MNLLADEGVAGRRGPGRDGRDFLYRNAVPLRRGDQAMMLPLPWWEGFAVKGATPILSFPHRGGRDLFSPPFWPPTGPAPSPARPSPWMAAPGEEYTASRAYLAL